MKLIVRIILFYIILFISVSCTMFRPKEKNVVGKYVVSSTFTAGELILLENGTFEYRYYMDVGGWCCYSKGNWLLTKNKLVLKSNPEYKEGNIMVIETISEYPNITLTVEKGLLSSSLGGVLLNDEFYYSDNNTGIIYIDKALKPATIKVIHSALFDSRSTYTVDDKNSNTFHIIIFKDLQSTYFDGSFKISKRHIKIQGLKYKKLK